MSKDPILFKPKTNNALLNYSHFLDPFFIRCACMFALNYELILLLLITLKTLMPFFFFLLNICMTINVPALVIFVHGVQVFYSYKQIEERVDYIIFYYTSL